ncbi:MAG: nickel-dependent hydrogenase large subunit [Deltaproteobacteria bacterium]|nr:nickel-dependent hydrogenase large subunit [Deltaproteobacteria bacterium]
MCFKNLPIDFDANGKATLRGGIADPFSYRRTELDRDQLKTLMAQNGYVREADFDPVTRIAGAMSFHTVIDFEKRKVLDANASATLFRGYEIILKGRDARDAIFISSRACGVCGGVHATAAALACEMAFGVVPPKLGIVLRNLALSMEFTWDNIMHLFMLAGPDYSSVMIKRTNPGLWEKAKSATTKFEKLHGYKTMDALFKDMDPLTGKLYLEALELTRVAREGYVTLMGKYPHPETIVPGGVSHNVSVQSFNVFLNRLMRLLDFTKRATGIWEDITEFFYEADPEYKKVGARPLNFADTGIWDDPDAYDATYENADEWGERRWATPGVIIGGKQVTTKLRQINLGLEEFVEHSFYEHWDQHKHPTDPSGSPLSPHHPWNKETKPKGEGVNWRERYSWATAPRWDRMAVETGTFVRMWNTVLAGKMPHRRFLDLTPNSMLIDLPAFNEPAMTMEWKIPQYWNAFERNRSRAYAVAYNAVVAYDNWLIGMELLRKGDTSTVTPYKIPKGNRMGVGFWGAGRGWLTHHMEIDDGAIVNYQIVTPSTIMASPKDPWGNPGPYEEAVLETPLLEEFESPEKFQGIDILRALRSFDPCMPCTTHMYGGGQHITQHVNTCACGVEP